MAAKNLGTLTVDLVAKVGGFVKGMNQAERASDAWRKKVERNLNAVRSTVNTTALAAAAAATVAAAAIATLTIKGLNAVDAQAKLARSLDTSYDSLTALKLAAEFSGLDNLEGSITRLNRRLGAAEFGGGAAAKAVKQLNLDLKELSSLDAAERVARISDAIVEGGFSAQRAARFAQDLGFEQKEAAQFFMQGGDAIRAYTEKVEAFGLSLSAIDTAKVEMANDAMADLTLGMQGVRQQLAFRLAPLIKQVSEDILAMTKDAGGLGNVVAEGVDKAVESLAFAANAFDGFGRVLTLVWSGGAVAISEFIIGLLNIPKAIAEVAQKIPMFGDLLSGPIEGLETTISAFTASAVENRKKLNDALNEPLRGEKILNYYEKAKANADAAADGVSDLTNGITTFGDEADKASPKIDKIAQELSALERAAKVWGMSADEVKIYDLRVLGATETQLAYADSLLETVAGLEANKKEQESYLKLVQDLRTDEEKLTDQFRERIAVLDAVAESASITADEYERMAGLAADAAFSDAPSFAGIAPEIGGVSGENAKIDKAEEELALWYERQLGMLEEFRAKESDLNSQWDDQELALKQQHEERLADIEEARKQVQVKANMQLFGALTGATKAFFGEQSTLYKAAFAMEKSYAIAKALMNVPQSYSDAYAAVVGIPIVGPVLAPIAGGVAAAAQVAQAGAIGNINMKGMAHSGIDSVPETGTWLLEKGERVTTAETSAKLDRKLDNMNKGSDGVVVNLYEDREKAGRVERAEDGSMSVFVDSIFGEGEAYQAISAKFGLQGVGI